MSILDLQSVLEDESSDTAAVLDVDCWPYLNYCNSTTANNTSSSSLALMHNVSMTQPIDSSALLAPRGKQLIKLITVHAVA